MEHLGGAFEHGDPLTFMPDVWLYLVEKYDLDSVLDVGCGFGQTVRWFIEQGITAYGIDGDPKTRDLSLPITLHDFCDGPSSFDSKVDLVWSSEFLEHIEEKYLPNVMPLFRLGRVVCITHAEPGQPGYHHVNCQTDEYWIEKFAEYAMQFGPEETTLLRSTDKGAQYGRKSLMVFT